MAAFQWLLIEAVTRPGVGLGGALVLWAILGDFPSNGTLGTLNSFALWPAMLILGMVFLRKVRRQGLTAADLDYRVSRSAVLIGVLAGGGLLGLGGLAYQIDARLFDQSSLEEFLKLYKDSGFVNAAILLPANGILGPVVEEFVWRGYIQTRLTSVWGMNRAILLTAGLFAAKHVIVDLSLVRTTSLVLIALGLGVIGARLGTLAATVAHIVMNSAATVWGLHDLGVF